LPASLAALYCWNDSFSPSIATSETPPVYNIADNPNVVLGAKTGLVFAILDIIGYKGG
jgi:hypothetical protein